MGSNMAYSAFIHNATYIYCAIVNRVKCVECAKLLVSVVLLILELSVGVMWGWGVFPSAYNSVWFCFLFLGQLRLVFSFVRCLPVSLV